jgi:hypothetical protein
MKENFRLGEKKPDDREMVLSVCNMLNDFIEEREEMDANLWICALITCLIHYYIESDVSYEIFCNELDRVKQFYKERCIHRNEKKNEKSS